MSAKHQTPEYRRNARIVQARIAADRRAERPVVCWRCRRPILPGQAADVGHVPGARGSALSELAPEHRHQTSTCTGNRAEGGKQGATAMHARRAPNTVPTGNITRYPI